ncbi:MAG: hypothetical protein WAO12_05810 [Venatoribacter sp.]
MGSQVTETNGVWSVPLSSNHTPYQQVMLSRRGVDLNYAVLLVHAEKFIALYENNSDSIPPINRVQDWEGSKKEGIRQFLNPENGPVEMPRVSFWWNSMNSWRTLWRDKMIPDLSFENGRHRARYMHYAGAEYFPIEVEKEGLLSLNSICGVIS